jgi:hypothetical protein
MAGARLRDERLLAQYVFLFTERSDAHDNEYPDINTHDRQSACTRHQTTWRFRLIVAHKDWPTPAPAAGHGSLCLARLRTIYFSSSRTNQCAGHRILGRTRHDLTAGDWI